jgi:hypothetical protein
VSYPHPEARFPFANPPESFPASWGGFGRHTVIERDRPVVRDEIVR